MISKTSDDCKSCGGISTIISDFSNGNIVCKNCGTVFEERAIDESNESRNFSNEQSMQGGKESSRLGGVINSNLGDENFTVVMQSRNNNEITRIQHRNISNSNNTHQRTNKRVDEICATLRYNDIVKEKAKQLISKVEEKKKLKGRNLDCVIAAVIYKVFKNLDLPKSLDEISNSFKLQKKSVSKCFNAIKNIINDTPDIKPVNIIGLVKNFDQKLEVDKEMNNLSIDICEKVCKSGVIEGRNPVTIASACILIANNLLQKKYTKKDICEKTKTTENTLKKAYNQLFQYKENIIPEKYKDKINILILDE
jgi:transcription initiation factor TFIIB